MIKDWRGKLLSTILLFVGIIGLGVLLAKAAEVPLVFGTAIGALTALGFLAYTTYDAS